jgi:hypothetical protein
MNCAAVAIAVMAVGSALVAQERPLRDIVVERNGPVEKRSSSNMPPVTLEELGRGADVIVFATIEDRTSYVSPDGTDVWTDLTLGSVQSVLPFHAAISATPGTVQKLVATQLGGKVMIDGHQVRSTHADLLPLEIGTSALFLLQRSGDRLLIARRYLGVFARRDREVLPLTQAGWFAAEYKGKPWDEFMQSIVSVARERKR